MLSKIAAFTAAACCTAVALAQTYPSKPIRLVNLPDAIVDRLASESAKAAKSAALEKQLEPDSAEAVGSTPKEFADFIAEEQARWKEVVQRAHVKVD